MRIQLVTIGCVALFGSIACASGGPEDTDDQVDMSNRDAVRASAEGQNRSEAKPGEVSILRVQECSGSQASTAMTHCYENHYGNYVTGCTYNTSTGYIVYSYAPCPLLPVGPPGCGVLGVPF